MVDIRETVFKEFYSLFKANITAKVTPAFINNVSEIPQVVVMKPKMDKIPYTHGDSPEYNRDGFLVVDVIATSSKALSQLTFEVEELIFLNLSTFSGRRMKLSDGEEGRLDVGDETAYIKTLTFDYIYRQ